MRKALFLLGILNDSALDWMIAVGAKREVPPGTVLIHEGQCVDAVFVIVEGLLARSSARCRLSTRVHISGRQRQRLLIARVLLRKPTLLILDEATIALDNRSQTIVTESLNRLKVTRILIAHRLSTIRQASRIYVTRGRPRRPARDVRGVDERRGPVRSTDAAAGVGEVEL